MADDMLYNAHELEDFQHLAVAAHFFKDDRLLQSVALDAACSLKKEDGEKFRRVVLMETRRNELHGNAELSFPPMSAKFLQVQNHVTNRCVFSIQNCLQDGSQKLQKRQQN